MIKDKDIVKYINQLVEEEQRLFTKTDLTETEKSELDAIKIELDQYWDLLRQRRALREFGSNPDDAKLREPGTVENYEQ